LAVQIYDQHAPARLPQGVSQIARYGGLAHPALVIDDGCNETQRSSAFPPTAFYAAERFLSNFI
jgi:hypothetical protein